MNKYNNSIKEMIKDLEDKHLCFPFVMTKKELNKYVDEILKNNNIKDDYDFVYYSNCIIKKALGTYDAHTKVTYKNSKCAYLPVRLRIENNKVYIIKTSNDYKDIEYSELLKINGIDVNKLREEFDKMIPYSTKGWFNELVQYYLRDVYYLKCLPSIDNDCTEIIYTIKDQSNKIRNIVFDTNKNYPRIANKIENYKYKIIDKTMIITYYSCVEKEKNQMINFVKEISTIKNIDNYIIDIRGNTGGDSSIIKPLIFFLKDKKIITLVDSNVFSSGRFAVCDLKNIGSRLVGTELGTVINCFGYSSKNINIKGCDNLKLSCSTHYFYLAKNKTLKGYSNKKVFEKHRYDDDIQKQEFYLPNIYMENTIEDYKNGYDRQLDTALKEINSIKKI